MSDCDLPRVSTARANRRRLAPAALIRTLRYDLKLAVQRERYLRRRVDDYERRLALLTEQLAEKNTTIRRFVARSWAARLKKQSS